MSQTALASAVQVSRQALSAIETGRAVPGVDIAIRLARVLGCRVEDLFGDDDDTRLDIELASDGSPGHAQVAGRLALANIAGRWVAYPLDRTVAATSADAFAVPGPHGPAAEIARPPTELRQNLVVMGCAEALGVVAHRLNLGPGPGRYLWFRCSSMAALSALSRQHTDIAGVHLLDAATGEANIPDVRRHAGRTASVLITLAHWELGLVVAPSNPKALCSSNDLGRPDLRLVSREPGAGVRRWLERTLASAGVPDVPAFLAATPCVHSHAAVATAVALGAADVGIATRDVADAHGLHFIPFTEERYDLVVPHAQLADLRIQRFFNTLADRTTRRELTTLGYDVRACGTHVADIPAA